jgi:hypothetical protein
MWSQNRYRGQEVPHLWGGALDFWRLDWVLFWDLAYASMVEIEGMPEE